MSKPIWEIYDYVNKAYPSRKWWEKVSRMPYIQLYAVYKTLKLRKAVKITIQEGFVYGNHYSSPYTPLSIPDSPPLP